MRLLRKSILWIILAISIGLWGYSYYLQKNPCNSPIQYKIGTFDTRFGISERDFLADVSQAAKIWEKPVGGKNLFEYNPNGKLTINLIYDSRQKSTDQNAVLQADLSKINSLAESIKQQYTSLESQYSAGEQEYKTELNQFNQAQDSYNSQVQYWNNAGGAPKSEYDRLGAVKNNLVSMRAVLENKRNEVNGLADQINSFIQKYNLLVDTANSNINTINSIAGVEFEEGLYNPGKNEIDIYQFSDSQKLIRVLAHELGHAIGLDHNSNPQSIMYALNQSDTMSLSADDLQEIKTRCNLP